MLTQERPDVPPSNRISVILEGEAKAFSSRPGSRCMVAPPWSPPRGHRPTGDQDGIGTGKNQERDSTYLGTFITIWCH